jgi:hypothetical protein
MRSTTTTQSRATRTARWAPAMTAALLAAACGGGGGGGDSGGPATSVLASDCRSTVLTTVGTTFRFDYAYSGAGTGGVSTVGSVARLTAFEGQTDAAEVNANMSEDFQATGQAATHQDKNTLSYERQTADADVIYGSELTFNSGADQGTIVRSVFSPPLVDRRFTLTAGQSTTFTTSATATVTLPSGRQEVKQLSETATVTFNGQEQVTVGAGSFRACRFEVGLVSATRPSFIWYQLGTGVVLKLASAVNASSTLTSELQATSRLNGKPL